MNNKRNIIIFLLVIIFILNYLIFIKLKTYKIDNFSDTSPTDYTLYSTTVKGPPSANFKYSQTTGYWVLLILKSQEPMLYNSDDILGLFAYLSCYKYFNSNIIGTYYPILDVMSKNLPLNRTIKNLQTSLSPREDIFRYNTVSTSLTNYLKNQSDPNNMDTLMKSCKALKYNLSLTETELVYLADIRDKWDTSINSYFTIDKFNDAYKLSEMFINKKDITNAIKTWQDFYLECNL